MPLLLTSRSVLAGAGLVSLAVLVLVAAGCAGRTAPAGPVDPSAGGVVSSGPMPSAPTASEPSEPADEVTPEPATDLVELPWVRAEAVPGRAELLVHATLTGGPPCAVLARVDQAETAHTVTVTLWVGRRPGAACDGPQPELAQPVRVRVALEAPLGSRPVRDGAR